MIKEINAITPEYFKYRLEQETEQYKQEIERLNNIVSKIETLVINHNCDIGDIYYKYNGRYLKSELKDRILELLELKGSDKSE